MHIMVHLLPKRNRNDAIDAENPAPGQSEVEAGARLRDNLTRLILESGRSVRSVSLEAGQSAAFLKHVLSGRSLRPSWARLHAVADVLGVTVAELTGTEGQPPPPKRKPRQVVEDQTELRVLELWRALDDGERGFMLNLLQRSALGK